MYKRATLGASGIEAIPNIDGWVSPQHAPCTFVARPDTPSHARSATSSTT